MKRGYNSNRAYRVRLASGNMGWRQRLQTLYTIYEVWQYHSCVHGLAKHLGFRSAKAAYDANPIIEGGINPSDFRIAP